MNIHTHTQQLIQYNDIQRRSVFSLNAVNSQVASLQASQEQLSSVTLNNLLHLYSRGEEQGLSTSLSATVMTLVRSLFSSVSHTKGTD